MDELIQLFANHYFIFGICYILSILGKCFVAAKISKNKDMSDEKVKSLTKMMITDINIKFRH